MRSHSGRTSDAWFDDVSGRAFIPGVFVNHTGHLSWQQRGVGSRVVRWLPLLCCAESALRAANGPGHRGHDDSGPIQVAVSPLAHRGHSTWVMLHRLADLDAKTQWNLTPPRLRIEEAVLDVAAGAR